MRPEVSQFLLRNTIWTMLLVACESEPPIKPVRQPAPIIFSQSQFYVLPGSSIVIDFNSVIEQPFTSISLTISQRPINGSLTKIDPFLWKYTSENFAQDTDQFVFSAVLDNSSTTVGGIVYLIRRNKLGEFPCGTYPVSDYVGAVGKKSTSLKPLLNDRMCGVSGNVDLFVHIQPVFGEAVVSGDSIIYTSTHSYTESDEFVYGVYTPGNKVSYGIVSINKNETFAVPAGFTDIFFVNDSVGFISGGTMIFKTNDGGKHWKELVYPRGAFEAINIEEIFFLDPDTGYAAFSRCFYENDSDCSGGWMVTRDGGVTWKRVDLTVPVTSIFFTSPSNGYISSLSVTSNDFWDPIIYFTILKTVDGGESWKWSVDQGALVGDLKIRFANDQTGFAFNADKIYSTADGGETWTTAQQNGYVGSLALAAESVALASINSTVSIVTSSTFVKPGSGAEWEPVANFPYSILAHEFSPSGGLGLAVGIRGQGANASIESLAISKTTDKGKTWSTLPGDFNGYPRAISIPSENVAYILCTDKVIKYVP